MAGPDKPGRLNTRIHLHPMDMDMYGRMVANVGYEGEFAVNFSMAAQGMAYHFNDFSSAGNRCLAEAQKIAETAGWASGDKERTAERDRGTTARG